MARPLVTAGCGVAAVGAFVVARSVESNVARLHPPLVDGWGYRALHDGAEVQHARFVWRSAAEALSAFDVRSVDHLILWHVLFDCIFVVAAAAFVWLASTGPAQRAGTAHWQWALGHMPLFAVALAADLTGNLLELVNVRWWRSDVAELAGYAWVIALGAYVVQTFCSAVMWGGPRLRQVWRAPGSVRVLVLAGVTFVVLVNAGRIGTQSDDLLGRWIADGWAQPLWTLALYAAYVLTVAAIPFLPASKRPRGALFGIVVTLVALAGGVVTRYALGWSAGLLVLGVGALLVALGSQGGSESSESTVGPVEFDTPWVRGMAAALPGLAMAIVMLRAGADALAVTDHRVDHWLLVLQGVAGLGIAVTAGWIASRPPALRTFSWARVVGSVWLVGVLVALYAIAHSPAAARHVGTFGVLFAGLAVAAAVAALARSVLSTIGTPLALRRLGFRRTPVVSLLVLWALATTFANGLTNTSTRPIRYYDARLVPLVGGAADLGASCVSGGAAPEPAPAGVASSDAIEWTPALEAQFCAWLARQPAGVDVVPLVLVTASGGGVRAAGWTTTALDCVLFRESVPSCEGELAADRSGALFAAGGASGGSVGIASTVAERLATTPGVAVDAGWVERAIGRDALAPTVARAVAFDALAGSFGVNPGRDRTWALEEAWGEPWARPAVGCAGADGMERTDVVDLGLLAATRQCAIPLLLFNSTDVASGCRVNVAGVDLDAGLAGDEQGSIDLVDRLAGGVDVPWFTAAFLSARFPLVSSSGRIEGAGGVLAPSLHLVDGGYTENSGTAQIAELWRQLWPLLDAYHQRAPGGTPVVRPVLVQIDNGEKGGPSSITKADDVQEGRVCTSRSSVTGELLRPIEAILGRKPKADRQAHSAMLASFGTFRLPGSHGGAVVVTLTMYEHPGRALPLGWTLSSNTLDDLRDQLAVGPNRAALEQLDEALRTS